jgi:hypothetical protein
MKKFTVFTVPGSISQYNAFSQFNQYYLDTFRQLGGEIRYLNLMRDVAIDSQTLNQAFMFYFGYLDNTILWDIYRSIPLLPIANHSIDHPFEFFVPTPELGDYVPSYFPIAFDPTWIDFIGRNRKHAASPPYAAAFLPMAGFTHPEVTEFKQTSQRPLDLLFAGSTIDPESLRRDWHEKQPASIARVIDTVVEQTTNTYGLPLDLMLEQGLNPECVQNVSCIGIIFQYVNEYTRAYYRLKLLRTLAQAGLSVTAYTNHPDLLERLIGANQFKIYPSVNFDELLKLMAQSKMVLNSRPNTQGITERIPSTMLNGAVSINDTNPHLLKEFIEDQDVVFYDYQQLDALPNKISQLLSRPDELDTIATTGQQKARAHHTVIHRAQTILTSVEEFRAMLITAHQR